MRRAAIRERFDPDRGALRDKNLAGDIARTNVTLAASFRAMTASARLEELRAEAAYARQRLDLYRARSYGAKPTSPQRMRDLARVAEQAEQRLAHAERAARANDD